MNNLLRLIGNRLIWLPIMIFGVTVLVFFPDVVIANRSGVLSPGRKNASLNNSVYRTQTRPR